MPVCLNISHYPGRGGPGGPCLSRRGLSARHGVSALPGRASGCTAAAAGCRCEPGGLVGAVPTRGTGRLGSACGRRPLSHLKSEPQHPNRGLHLRFKPLLYIAAGLTVPFPTVGSVTSSGKFLSNATHFNEYQINDIYLSRAHGRCFQTLRRRGGGAAWTRSAAAVPLPPPAAPHRRPPLAVVEPAVGQRQRRRGCRLTATC